MAVSDDRCAVIDLGSNTCILCIFSSHFEIVEEHFRIPQLAKGMAADDQITGEAMQRAVSVLQEYKAMCAERGVMIARVGGTAPFRKAKNASDIIADIFAATGLQVEVLSEETEAQYSFFAATCDLNADVVVIDIGGGSTELAWAPDSDGFFSVPCGCVDLTERFFANQFTEEGICDARSINEAIQHFSQLVEQHCTIDLHDFEALVGVAGTPTTLAMMKLGLREYQADKVDRVLLSRDEIEEHLDSLRQLCLKEKMERFAIPQGRAEIIVAGCVILLSAMDVFGFDRTLVRTRGVRHGIALDLLGRIKG